MTGSPSATTPRRSTSPRIRDLLGVLVVGLVVFQATHWITEPGAQDAGALAYGPGIVAAVAGRRTAALAGAVMLALLSTGFQVGTDGADLLDPSVVMPLVLLASAVLLGEAISSRNAYLAEVQRRLAQAQEDREREAERRVTEERLRIARDLHDVMGHTLAVVSVHAGLAADTIATHPDRAHAAVGTIREATRDAMAELRTLIEVLRHPGAEGSPTAPMPGLEQLDELVAMANGGGLEVRLTSDGEPRRLSPLIELTAYRIVQESLTNVLRHADASVATVRITYRERALEILVEDDGRGGNGRSEGGHGIAGMRERAAALGGHVEAGPGSHGGFRIHATLPVEGRA